MSRDSPDRTPLLSGVCSILGRYETNPLIAEERAKASFNVEKLTYFLEGDQDKTERRRELEKKFYEDEFPRELIKVPVDYLSHQEIYEEALIKASKMYVEAFNLEDPREVLGIAEAFHYEASPLLLHFVMFIPALMGHCNDEQQAQWLPDAIELKIIGTYAQTELGHGSYLKGLQTIATYDRSSQTFALNSPNLESIKWWPGGLGKTANFAIVQAQLYIEGVHHGLHPFIVQLRDLETHLPLKGIEVGELGPKMGFKAADNGYLKLNQVVIPRTNMLMKNATIDENGVYHAKEKTDKLNLGTMLFVRVIVIDMISYNISKAVTIATRYSAVRRQGPNPDVGVDGDPNCPAELKIIDYQAQRYKLIPCIALSHACKAVFISLMTAFKDVNESMSKRGDFGMIPLLHAMSSGLKALTTDLGAAAVEVCRRACGGNGFLLVSGLPRIFANTVAACTYEGENTILYLQTARYLFKTIRNSSTQVEQNDEAVASSIGYLYQESKPDLSSLVSRLSPSSSSSSPSSLPSSSLLSDPATLLKLFAASSYYHVHRSFDKVEKLMAKGYSYDKAWIASQNELIKGARCHLIYYMLTKYHEWVDRAKSYDQSVDRILGKLCLFYIYYNISENKGDFLAVGIPLECLESMFDEMSNLMDEIRPDMVPLVDAFDLHDMVLMSALGCKDGNVYNRLFELAKKAPLNQVDPNPSFMKYVKDLTKAKL